jgi:hypothetical protein
LRQPIRFLALGELTAPVVLPKAMTARLMPNFTIGRCEEAALSDNPTCLAQRRSILAGTQLACELEK